MGTPEIIDCDKQAVDRANHTYSTIRQAAVEELERGEIENAKELDTLAERIRRTWARRGVTLKEAV